MQTRESYYVAPDMAALHLPLTKSITGAEEDKAFRLKKANRPVEAICISDLHAIVFSNWMNLHFNMFTRGNPKCMYVFPTNCILITICPECFASSVRCRKVKASALVLCGTYVPSCRLACLAVIMLWPASHCEMSSWILKRLSLHLYLTIVERHSTWRRALRRRRAITSRMENVEMSEASLWGQSYDWKNNMPANVLSHQASNKLLNHLRYCTMFIQECDSMQMAARDHLAVLSASKS